MDALPKVIVDWADIPLAVLIILLTYILRPTFDPEMGKYARWQEVFRGDRIILLPLVLGGFHSLVFGLLGPPPLDWAAILQRSMATGCGAAIGYRGAKIFFPTIAAIFERRDDQKRTEAQQDRAPSNVEE
jgi:hypothetical protein